jgi:hypothetical protein
LFNKAVIAAGCGKTNKKDGSFRIWKEVVITYLKALFRYSWVDIERKRENSNEDNRYSGHDWKKVLPEG